METAISLIFYILLLNSIDAESIRYFNNGYVVNYPKINKAKQMIISMRCNDKYYNMLVDTGAADSYLNSTLLKDRNFKWKRIDGVLGSDLLGTSNVSHVCETSIAIIGGVNMKKSYFMSLDLSYINKSYELRNIDHIDGIIGCDIIEKHKFIIDYNMKRIFIKNR
ncbi:MAG: aspartyl protease family protein [Planctomycetia bacterium]|nr:aspartyl protease family protein [Planctomycetia bacterium]